MRAVVSGQAGIALLWDGNRLSSLHAGVDGPPVPRRPREIPLLLGAANDLEFLDRIERPQVAQKLARASDEADALHLALILLDATLPYDIRREASLELEELLDGPEIQEHLEKTFYARPLPAEADLAGALVHRAGPTERVGVFLRSLDSLQMAIAEIAWAWREIPDEVFGSPGERAEAQTAAMRGGLFRDLVRARAEAREGEAFWRNGLLHPSVQILKNQRAVLQAWLSPFREDRRAEPAWPESPFVWAQEVAEAPEEETGSPRIRVDRRQALAGDRAAAERLVQALKPVIQRSVAHSLLLWHRGAAAGRSIRQEVEDLTQEILLQLFADDGKVLRRWHPAKGLSLERFVGLVAQRQTSAVLRADKRSPWKEIPTLPEELDQAISPEAAASSREQLELLLARLKKDLEKDLSPLGWHLFDLLFLRELSIEEVVEQTGLSSDAVYRWRSRLSHRVQRWRAEMSARPGKL